jgi:poly(hydroxyalkanoate) granule-associated protein
MARKGRSAKGAAGVAGEAQARLLEVLHQVWLAGLGAVSKAEHGAPKLLEELIAEGARVHADTRNAAEKALRGAFGEVQSALSERMSMVRGEATDAFENLEKVFRARVHRALTQLGVPSADEVSALSKRVDVLNASINTLARARKSGAKQRAHAAAH